MAQESSPYDVVIADLESKRDQINSTIEMLRALRATGATTMPPLQAAPQKPATTPTDLEIPRDAFFGMTIPEAAKAYLSFVKATKPNTELCNALLKGGFKTQALNFFETVRSTLQRHPDFVKVNGEWGLAEWYGKRGGGRRFRRAENAQNDADALENQKPSVDNSEGS